MNLITSEYVERLNLKKLPSEDMLLSLDGSQMALGSTSAQLASRNKAKLNINVNFAVVKKIANHLPSSALEIDINSVIDKNELADITFDIPSNVEILLGASVWANIISNELIHLEQGLVAQSTSLGWIIFGENAEESALACHMNQALTNEELDNALRRLWQTDEEEEIIDKTPDERWCEENFVKTSYRDADGRYVVTIPIQHAEIKLGESFEIARRRFMATERRLQADPELKEKYVNFKRDYEQLGHMQKATRPPEKGKLHYYIPHHAVAKKFRVVFDASAKTTNGVSLNEIQLSGPKIQPDLYDTMLQFRIGEIAISADVRMMFGQVKINPTQWDLQRIVWRESPENELTEYWLTVVTYGMASSGFNAVRAMVQCARDNAKRFPIANKVIQSNFYIDDMLVSVHTVQEAKRLIAEVTHCLHTGGFELAKWSSNIEEAISGECIKDMTNKEIVRETSVLGLIWDPVADSFGFKINLPEPPSSITKRSVASDGARIFDPTGYIGPITMQAKLFMQNLWRIGVDWDEELAPEIANTWHSYYSSLHALAEIKIPRWLGTKRGATIQLHAFCDASAKAFGAVIYLRTEDQQGRVKISLLTSKNKVADLQTITIPRMELCAARLAAKLAKRVSTALQFRNVACHFWSDSEIVLHWLQKFPAELKLFVANRVATIQACSKTKNWHHVDSKSNPADILSRGASANTLKDSEMWWSGPEFLRQPKGEWPTWSKRKVTDQIQKDIDSEKRKMRLHVEILHFSHQHDSNKEIYLLHKYESLTKVLRITVYTLRFIKNCRRNQRSVNKATYNMVRKKRKASQEDFGHKMKIPKTNKVSHGTIAPRKEFLKNAQPNIREITPITPAEYEEALKFWLRFSQQLYYGEEIACLKRNIPIKKSSEIYNFTPYIDSKDNLLRMRGRLEHSELTYDQKHPILLPSRAIIAKRLIASAHLKTLHGGTQLTMQHIRERYWITGLRSATKKHIHHCITCIRFQKRASTQLMADLPSARVTMTRPFVHCGVDYAGPFKIKPHGGRSKNITLNAYVAVFVCFASKAVHLELVGDLTTRSFLSAFDRLIARRNHVQHMYSDNATNFTGAARELKQIYDMWKDSEVADYLSLKGIEWHFNTPLAPHHGGLWEAAVKSFKYHLTRIIADQSCTFEELYAIIVRIEATLNSRPLVSLSDNLLDSTVITPGQLISGGQFVRPLNMDVSEIPTNRLDAWQKIDKIEQKFWQRWSQDYLVSLQRRNKWTEPQRNFQPGDLVFIFDDLLPPAQWKKGRITHIFKGKDGLVRSATIKTANSQYNWPITKLCYIPLASVEEEQTAKISGANNNQLISPTGGGESVSVSQRK